MHKTNLRKVGGSVMLAVPTALLEILELSVGATVGMAVDHGRLVVEPQSHPRYTLDELLARCDASEVLSYEDQAWINEAPLGHELL
jgi:antitoxin ChpS